MRASGNSHGRRPRPQPGAPVNRGPVWRFEGKGGAAKGKARREVPVSVRC